MIKEHCFTEEWLDEFKSQAAHKRIDKIILEKIIYALHLLERLSMEGRFRIDDAIPAAARVAYLAAKILMNDLTPLAYYEGQDIKKLSIEDPDWNSLNRLKKQPDKSSFYYWYQTTSLLKK